MLINAKIAKQNVAESSKNIDKMREAYWRELEPSLNESISNLSRDAINQYTLSIDKRFAIHVKQKLSEAGYSCQIHASSKSEDLLKITISWEE